MCRLQCRLHVDMSRRLVVCDGKVTWPSTTQPALRCVVVEQSVRSYSATFVKLECLYIISMKNAVLFRSSPKTLQKRHIGNVRLTYPNPYEVPPFDDSLELKERPSGAIDGAENAQEELQA